MRSILVVDDEFEFRRLLGNLLARKDYSVLEAANGKEALNLLHETEVSLMITDIFMPEMEGIETIIEARKIVPEMKIIAITGKGFPNPTAFLKTARHIGANRTFEKPFDFEELLDVIQDLITPKRQ